MKMNIASRSKTVSGTFLVCMLLFAFALVPMVFADSVPPQDITVDSAYNMIYGGAFPELAILDVRNQSEYDINHLYGAYLIPLHELETRLDEISDCANTEIIVYCGLGGRSELAAGILADNGFTKVYNMLGGIAAWIEAGYPVYTTYHNVTVDITGNQGVHLDVEPLLLTACTSWGENSGCSSELTDVQSTVLEEGDDYTVTLITYVINGTTFEATVTTNLLWSYEDTSNTATKTADFSSIEFVTENTTEQFYVLTYLVEHAEYNLTLATTLLPLDSETYNSSFTVVNYLPVGDTKIPSLELVEFNSPVTLSQLYSSLAKVAKKMGHEYTRDGEENDEQSLVQLGQYYQKMSKETKTFSKIVKRQLREYNKEILNNSAALMDGELECSLCLVACPLVVFGCWAVCWAFPVLCAYCATLTYYYLTLGLACDAACYLAGLCT